MSVFIMVRMKRLKTVIVLSILLVAVASIGAILGARIVIEQTADGLTYSDVTHVPDCEVAVVLGCARYLSDGRENLFFRNRIDSAARLFQANKVQFLLVSGDNRFKNYNEPHEMKNALIELGVPETVIFCDYAGLNTLDSVVRAHKIFAQERFIVVSQEFHNKRAIFIGRNRGLEVYGYNAVDVGLQSSFRTKIREELARVKALMDVWILRRQPKFLGEPVTIAGLQPLMDTDTH